jgi:hypothetical protein
MTAPQPTLAGFQNFIKNVMKVPASALPVTSPFIGYAFANALALVNPALRVVCIPQFDAAQVELNSGGFSIYSEAVYNLAADNLINYAPDQNGSKYFAKLRKQLNITGFVSGIVQASADESTSVSLVVQDAAKNFTLANIQNLKTPYGRQYLGWAQSYGPSTWGIS